VIPAGVVTRLVLHLDCDDTVGITRVALFNPGRLARQGRDRNRGEGAALVQRRCKREIDLVPWYEIARGRAGVCELTAFERANMPDGVRRMSDDIAPRVGQRLRLSRAAASATLPPCSVRAQTLRPASCMGGPP